MLYDFTPVMKTRQGVTIKQEDGNDLTAMVAIINALDAPVDQVEGIEKAARYCLATKIMASEGKPDLKPEDAARIKEVVGKAYGPLIVGQVWALVDGLNQ